MPKQAPPSEGSGAPSDAPADLATSEAQGLGALPQKYALGPTERKPPEPQHIPWGYGQDRVTAMAVDPANMFAYWEITDDAIERAREGLGPAGRDAWLNLRVYDITGRIFDGTNAHSYFDHRVERGDRQWFMHLGKPASTACVELGLKSIEGYFVKVARSGRVDFPRTEPVPPSEPQWLTVFAGRVGETHTGPVPGHRPARADAQAGPAAPPPGASAEHGGEAWEHAAVHRIVGHMLTGRWEWHQILRGGTFGEQKIEWVGPLTRTTWEAGPFTYPVDLPVYVEEHAAGEAMVHAEGGLVHVLYGPWQVVIRGIGARAERRILATWQIYYSWVVHGGSEEVQAMTTTGVPPGGSELLMRGASERRWLGASEIRLAGASEIFQMGASEIRYVGATETLFWGASERRLMGASQYFYRGASEVMYGGASEVMYRGASEMSFAGASEALAGASEKRLGGASEVAGAYPPPANSAALPDK